MNRAVDYGYPEVIKLLLEKEADIHAENHEDLRYDAIGGNLEVLKLIVERGANVNAENDKALQLAKLSSIIEGHHCCNFIGKYII
jgi:ankyrin repeat protein